MPSKDAVSNRISRLPLLKALMIIKPEGDHLVSLTGGGMASPGWGTEDTKEDPAWVTKFFYKLHSRCNSLRSRLWDICNPVTDDWSIIDIYNSLQSSYSQAVLALTARTQVIFSTTVVFELRKARFHVISSLPRTIESEIARIEEELFVLFLLKIPSSMFIGRSRGTCLWIFESDLNDQQYTGLFIGWE